MAKTSSLKLPPALEEWGDQPVHQRILIWLGALNGLGTGLALSLGIWGAEIVRLANLPVVRPFGGIIVSGAILLLVSLLVGWLTAGLRKAPITVLAWGSTAVFTTLLIENTPTTMQTLSIWLADSRFWGLPLYPVPTNTSLTASVLSGIFLILAMFLLALFQETRLLSLGREFLGNKYPSLIAWLRFMVPLVMVAGVGALTSTLFSNPYGSSLNIVNQTIQVTRTYPGDLFALGLEDGISYAAINAVRDQLDGPYMLSVSTLDLETGTVIVMATFDNGAWIKCRLVYAQLSFCEDASPPYTTGLAHLLAGTPLPEDCVGCLPRVSPELSVWLSARQSQFSEPLIITRQAAEGSFVLMRAATVDGRDAIECWFSGQPQVKIDRCAEQSE